jgi:hypothetical protein
VFSSVQGLFRLLKQSYWESNCPPRQLTDSPWSVTPTVLSHQRSRLEQRCASLGPHHHGPGDFVVPGLTVGVEGNPDEAQEHDE